MSNQRRDFPPSEPPGNGGPGSAEVLGRVPPARRPAPDEPGRDPLSESSVERRSGARVARRDPRAEDDTGPMVDHVRPSMVDAVGTASIPPPSPGPGPTTRQRAVKLVDELKVCGPGDEGPLVAPLLALGDDGLQAAMAAFPGARWFNRYRPHLRMPRGRDLSPVCRLLVEFGDAAVPYVLPLLDSDDPDDRYMGALLAGDIGHPELIPPLGHMVFDADPTLRDAAVHALGQLGPSAARAHLAEQLRGQLANPQTDADFRLFALRAVGVMRLREAIPEVIPLVGSGSSHVRDAARRVLLTMTGNDLGGDAAKWRTWHARHAHEPRVRWLVAGLAHGEQAVREVALRELERLTGERLDFDPRAGWLMRTRGLRRWRRWLERNPGLA